MPKVTRRAVNDDSPPTKLQRLRRELVEVKAKLARLETEVAQSDFEGKKAVRAGKARQPRRARSASAAEIRAPVAPAVDLPVVTPAAVTSPAESAIASPAVAPDVPASRPSGNDLNDPKTFGLMPPLSDLERGTISEEEFRQRLGRHMPFVTKVLHTSGVAADVWREWRAFEKAARQLLGEMAARSPDAA